MDESRSPGQPSHQIDPSEVLMATFAQDGSNTISVDRANLLQSQRGRACETFTTNYHDLDCGHLVATSMGFPTLYDLKAPCASNCKRSQSPTHRTLNPFVCPQCLETLIRRNYIKTHQEFVSAGYLPDPDPSRNVEKWVCCSIRHVTRLGLRIVQAMTGVFLLGNEEKYLHINFIPSVVSSWFDQRSLVVRQSQRSRSRSPQQDTKAGFLSIGTSKSLRIGTEGDSGSNTTCSDEETQRRVYRDRSHPTQKSLDLNGLVEHFSDARIGLLEDIEVAGLLERVSKI